MIYTFIPNTTTREEDHKFDGRLKYRPGLCSRSELNNIATLFVIVRNWKQPRCPSTKEWIQKMWFIYTVEYYSANKNLGIISFAGKWMKPENIQNDVIQIQKDMHDMYSLRSRY